MTISDHDIAWCGGIIDAIGLIRLRETEAGSQLPSVYVSTAHLPIANRLADLTGMKVTTVRRDYKRLGCSQHCTEPHQHVASVTARWSVTGARALTFLQAVRPYLHFKADDADLAISAGSLAPSKPATSRKMRELGWPA